jgi:hypothetical protein
METYNISTFKTIFKGLERAYGQYRSGEQKENGKKGGQAYIVKGLVTDKMWQDHLEGNNPSLGIIPIMDNSKCHWGCIDVDMYPINLKELVQKINSKQLPLIVCRSKSGGAHIFIFTKEAVPAILMRDKLSDIAAFLGFANCEIFPKQIEIRADRGDTGNFLNLPYFGADDTERYAINNEGKAYSLIEFFTLYSKVVLTEEELRKVSTIKRKDGNGFDGPPCLEHLMNEKIPEGGRDNTLYQYAVYAKKKWPDKWRDKIDEFNHKYMDPYLPSTQVQKTISQHDKKDYQFKCKDQPMCSVCNASLCKSRKYGIGNDYNHTVTDLTKYESDESVWFLNLDGRRLCINTDEFFDQAKFRKACMNSLNILPNKMSARDWDVRIQSLLAEVDIIDMPEEVTKIGRFDNHLEAFLADQGEAMTIDEILIDKAWTPQDEEVTYFKLSSLEKYLTKQRFSNFSSTQVCARIRELDGDSTKKKIRGKLYHLWYVPKNFKDLDVKDNSDLKLPDLTQNTPF